MYEVIKWEGQYGNNLQIKYNQIDLNSLLESSFDLSELSEYEWDNDKKQKENKELIKEMKKSRSIIQSSIRQIEKMLFVQGLENY